MNSSVITVKMPVELRSAVRAKSRATGVSLSAVVRSALAAWVADERPIVEPADLDAQLDAVSTDARCCVSR